MKHYAQVTENGKERLGSFAVLILDSRNRLEVMIADAKDLQKREKADGVRIVRSQRFLDTDKSSSAIIWEV